MKPGQARVVGLCAAMWALLLGGAGALRADGIPLAAIAAGEDGGAETDGFDFWNLRAPKPLQGDAWGLTTAPPPLVPRLAETAAQPVPTALTPPLQFDGLLGRLSDARDATPDPASDPWAVGLKRDPNRLIHSGEARGEVLHVKSNQDVPDPLALRTDPLARSNWKATESLTVPLPAESFFLFGEMNGSNDLRDNMPTHVTGRTGVGWKWSPLPQGELQVRGGSILDYGNPWLPAGVPPQQLALEVLAKVKLVGPLQLQSTTAAIPALGPTERDQLKQDLKVALPVRSGEFHVGARYRTPDPQYTPWISRAELYFGVNLKR